jgi:hypothetical protein
VSGLSIDSSLGASAVLTFVADPNTVTGVLRRT